jgi:hypothetical protein
MTSRIPENLRRFIQESTWTFAKTYAKTWPHEYIVEEQVDGALYSELAKFIDANGYHEKFYNSDQIYFDYDGRTYWHMENIINRCPVTETYHRRKQEGRLPVDAQ